MNYKFIEATDETLFNHGKFMVMQPGPEEWSVKSSMEGYTNNSLLRVCGWTPHHLMVMDLQTGEGAWFYKGGVASADLNKHKIWVCPMFEPFLEWLYKQDLTDLEVLPAMVNLGDVPTAMSGYRREGKEEHEKGQ